MKMEESPRMTIISLGAGVQSTALLVASAEGILPKVDACIFSDTGWEPEGVYRHLDRLEEEVAGPAGIPIYRVSAGNIRDDALSTDHRFASMPIFFINESTGKKGMGRRQCTNEYKLKPITRKIRELLGAPLKENGIPGRLKGGKWVEQWIGISTDEFERAKDSTISYAKSRFPLLELNWSRTDCMSYLESRGWGETTKSACIGCPFHTNSQWREIRDNDPKSWDDAVEFDHAIRHGGSRMSELMKGALYLHRSCVPLDQAPIHLISKAEAKKNEQRLFEDEKPFHCSPFACDGEEMMPEILKMLKEDEDE